MDTAQHIATQLHRYSGDLTLREIRDRMVEQAVPAHHRPSHETIRNYLNGATAKPQIMYVAALAIALDVGLFDIWPDPDEEIATLTRAGVIPGDDGPGGQALRSSTCITIAPALADAA